MKAEARQDDEVLTGTSPRDGPEWAGRLAVAARELRPLRLYERWEAATALLFASTPTPQLPHRLALSLPELWRWRNNPAGIVVAGAKRYPNRLAVIDGDEALTFAELERRTNALCSAWRKAGLGPETTVGLLCHNRAMLIEVATATYKLGAHLVFLNTGFAPPQVADVVAREGIDVLVRDADLAASAAQVALECVITDDAVRQAIATGDPRPPRPPRAAGRVIVLTSGTTGTPKGAIRSAGGGNPLDAASLLTCIPLMSGDTTVVAAPLFHGLGLVTANIALALGSTVVLRPSFNPEQVLRDIEENNARVLVAVPAMLQRIVALPPKRLRQYDVSSLRVILASGAALPGDLARRVMAAFGDILYNAYGSTEVALATIAAPRDLRAAPGTAGRVIPGVELRILDDQGHRVAPGTTGRIFVGSSLRFDGYTGGGYKDVVDGLVATGDLGRMDRWERLFVEGREDEMIVSGGENVFPAEVEEVLAEHQGVVEAAAIGVPDDEFGQRLRAFVVPLPDLVLDADELRSYVRERLARFKTPRDVVFLDRLPRNSTGKVLKRELAEYEIAVDHPDEKDPST